MATCRTVSRDFTVTAGALFTTPAHFTSMLPGLLSGYMYFQVPSRSLPTCRRPHNSKSSLLPHTIPTTVNSSQHHPFAAKHCIYCCTLQTTAAVIESGFEGEVKSTTVLEKLPSLSQNFVSRLAPAAVEVDAPTT